MSLSKEDLSPFKKGERIYPWSWGCEVIAFDNVESSFRRMNDREGWISLFKGEWKNIKIRIQKWILKCKILNHWKKTRIFVSQRRCPATYLLKNPLWLTVNAVNRKGYNCQTNRFSLFLDQKLPHSPFEKDESTLKKGWMKVRKIHF